MILIIPPSIHGNIFSLGIGYLASMLVSHNKEVKVINCSGVKNWLRIIDNWLREDKIKLVGITTDMGNIGNAIYISKFIRENHPQAKIIFGGPYATAIYKELIPQYADIVALGEAEKTIIEIATGNDFKNIKGIAYFDGEIILNPQVNKIDDLDSLPFPIQVGSIYESNIQYDEKEFLSSLHFTGRLITSRGCPYDCMYCTKLIHGYKIRLRSIDNVIEEIEYLVKKQNAGGIEIYDDNFTFYPDRVKALCERIISKNYKDLIFTLPGGIRPDIGDIELFKILKRAGFCNIAIAVESGSQTVADRLGRKSDLNKAADTFKIAREIGFITYGYFLWGTPFDNKETLKQTIEFAKKLNPDMLLLCMLRPFPGTKLYEYILKHGKFLHNILENYPSVYNPKMIYEIPGMNNKEIERMYYKAYLKYYFRLKYIYCLVKQNFIAKIKILFVYYFHLVLKDVIKDKIRNRFLK